MRSGVSARFKSIAKNLVDDLVVLTGVILVGAGLALLTSLPWVLLYAGVLVAAYGVVRIRT